MKAEELKKHIEERGYEVRAIRVFSKSFHVTYWHPEYKAKAFYKVPIDSIGWDMIQHDYPQIDSLDARYDIEQKHGMVQFSKKGHKIADCFLEKEGER